MYILDTNSVIYFFKGLGRVAERLLRVPPNEVALSAVVLYEIEDLTGEEISEALSLPLGTVYSRLQLARAAFKREVVRMETAKEKPPAARVGGRA